MHGKQKKTEYTERAVVDIQKKIFQLLETPGVNLHRIVQLLGAEECLEYIQGGRNQAEVVQFNVQKYISRQIGDMPQMPEHYIPTNTVILEPGEGELHVGTGTGEFSEKKTVHRTLAVMQLLKELKLQYVLIDGNNRNDMVRQLSYVVFVIPELKKLLFVNDEENNASYMIHSYEENTEWKEYSSRTKDTLRKIALESPEEVSVIEFRTSMSGFISRIRELLLHTPEPIDRMEEKFEVESILSEPPAQWLTRNEIAAKSQRSKNAIARWIAKVEATISEPTEGIYKGKNNQPTTYYSPLILAAIEKNFLQFESAPNGWMTVRAMATAVGVTDATINKFLERNKMSDADSGEYYDERYKVHTYYAPSVIERVQKYFEKRDFVPDGWLSVPEIAKKLGRSRTTITRIISLLSFSDTENAQYTNKGNRVFTYYSPAAFSRIEEESLKRKR